MKETVLTITNKTDSYEISAFHREVSDELIVLVHGLGCSKESFKSIWEREDFKDRSILTFDLLGYGNSSKPEEFSYYMEDHAVICAKVLNQFKENKYHVIAHSMGGAIGLLLTEIIGDSVLSFANIEGNLIFEDCRSTSRRTSSVSYEEFKNEMLPKMKERFKDDEKIGFGLSLTSAYGYYKSAESLVKWTDSGKLLDKFKDLKCRKVYFYGDQNKGYDVINKLGDIQKIEIPNSGHFLMKDNPQQFYNELNAFINQS